MERWGDVLERLAAGGVEPIILAAPFVKAECIFRLLNAVPSGLQVTCVTRWKPEEVLAGVSDLEVWEHVKKRPGTELRLRGDLHAKYYRFGAACLVGSANLTAKALGWCAAPNLEVLVLADPYKRELMELEAVLLKQSLLVDEAVYEQTKQAVLKLGERLPVSALPIDRADEWIPFLEHPERLYNCYMQRRDLVLESAFRDGQRDIATLKVPDGLNKASFRAFIREKLLLLPVVTVVDGLARDGIGVAEGQAIVDEMFLVNGEQGERTGYEWTALKAWLLYFLGDRYREKYGHHGPVFESGSIIGARHS